MDARPAARRRHSGTRARIPLRAAPIALGAAIVAGSGCTPGSTLPERLEDAEFWTLSARLSEPAGTFDVSDNLVSNEPHFAENVRRLHSTGGVYIGVGPEQNFSYIARLRPAMAFVIDIRRENFTLHLLYKVLFELSADRADFVSRLFSRPRPPGLDAEATVEEIFTRFDRVAPSPDILEGNAALVREQLRTKNLPLSDSDSAFIEHTMRTFYADGPGIHFWGSRAVDTDALRPSYRRLMTAPDARGQPRSFLASEAAFVFVRDLHSRNLIVPVVGDFAGPSAIRRVADYIRQHGDVVHAFYGSNVGVYLTRDRMRLFCGNLGTLPSARRAWFIERDAVRSFSAKLSACRADSK